MCNVMTHTGLDAEDNSSSSLVRLWWHQQGQKDDTIQYMAADKAEPCSVQSLLPTSFATDGLFVVGNYFTLHHYYSVSQKKIPDIFSFNLTRHCWTWVFFWWKYFVKSRQLLVGMNISSLTTMLAQADRLLCCWPVKYRLAGISIKILLKHIHTPI